MNPPLQTLPMRLNVAVLILFASLAGPGAGAQSSAVIHPRDVLGHEVGADRKLADWSQITGYFSRMAAAPGVRVDTLGPTTGGLPFLAVTITHPSNMQRIEDIRRREARLADPRTLSPAEEESIVRDQPAVILLSANIHGSEIGSSQMMMELAWRLVANDTLQELLRNVVVLLFPSMNPDGTQLITEWYRRNVGTRWEGGPLPWLYHHYVGHDNNRDWYMVTQKETRLATDFLYRRWFPQVVYDIHQMGNSGMRIFVPPMVDPVNPNIDPLIVRGINLIGSEMSWALEQAGKKGVGDGVLYDMWWHGGFRSTPTRHNIIALLTEAASVRVATPITQTAADLTGHSRGLPRYEQRVSFPNPWPGGVWRLRDIVEYELIASEALVRFASRHREELVRGLVQMARRQIALGATGSPRAFLIPKAQHDAGATRALLSVLQTGGVEIHDSRDNWVVRLDQPYRAHAKDLLEVQNFPAVRLSATGPVERPYDVAGWTLPLQMGVRVVAADTLPTVSLAPLPPFETSTCTSPTARSAKVGRWVVLDPRNNDVWPVVMRSVGSRTVRRMWGTDRYEAPESGTTLPVGTFYVDRRGGGGSGGLGSSGGSALGALDCFPSLDVIPRTTEVVSRPRVALYKSWTASMDEGWTRWLFDQTGVPYSSVTDSTIRAGSLRDHFDVLLVPDMSLRDVRSGMSEAAVPPAFAGGLGSAGIAAVRRFVEDGGTLVLLDRASEFGTAELGIGVGLIRVGGAGRGGPDADEGGSGNPGQRREEALYAPGSILRVLVNPHRVTAGLPDTAAVYFTNSLTFDIPAGSPARELLRYPGRGEDILLSGFLQGAGAIAGKAAAIEAPLGKGRVFMFGFRPQYRGQSHGTFKLIFNALLAGGSPGGR
ncbi:MAG: M14 family metallopeptidase [Gemmatimonadota bacterium]